MAKFAPDAGLDAALNYFTDADKLVLCSAQPTTYAEANDLALRMATLDLRSRTATATTSPRNAAGTSRARSA